MKVKKMNTDVAEYIASLENEIKLLKQKNEQLQRTVDNLSEQLVKRNRMIFGRKSEKTEYMIENQMTLFNETVEENTETAPKKVKVKPHERKAKRTKAEKYKNLKHRKEIIKIKKSERFCETCKTPLQEIGVDFVRSEIRIIPEQIYIADVYVQKYKCPECEKKNDKTDVIKAEIPKRPIPYGLASPSAIAYVMTQKYQMGAPLYRIEQYLNSKGIELSRNTLANWVILAAKKLKPVKEFLNKLFNLLRVGHTDETRIRVLTRDGEQTNSVSTMWVRVSGKHEKYQFVLYDYKPTKSQKSANELLSGFTGVLTTDGYDVYNNLKNCTHSCCMAHARRKLYDSIPEGIKEGKAYEMFMLINKIYSIERGIQKTAKTLEEIKEQRQKKIRPIFDALMSCLENTNPLPDSQFEKAVKYIAKRRKELSVFIDNPEVAIDNNRCEQKCKSVVMARKAFLFSDSEKGAEASADIFSIVESAKMNGLSVYDYLTYLLTELPKFGDEPTEEQIKSVLPWSESLPECCKIKNGGEK